MKKIICKNPYFSALYDAFVTLCTNRPKAAFRFVNFGHWLSTGAGKNFFVFVLERGCSKKANKINLPLFSLPSPRAFAGRCAGGAGGEPRFALVIGGGGIALGDGLRHARGIQPQLGRFHPPDFIAQTGGFLEL